MIKVYLIIQNKVDWDCIFSVFSALPCYQKILMQGGGGQKEGTEMFCFSTNAYVMMHMQNGG